MFKANKDIGVVVKSLYDEYYNLSESEESSLDDYLSEGAGFRKSYYKMLYQANVYAMVKISHLLNDKNHTNSGFTYGECSSITMYCIRIIDWTQKQEYLKRRDKKEYELALKVLPYLYKNMKADKYSTMEVYAERKKELQKAGLDISMLDNFKKQILKKEDKINL